MSETVRPLDWLETFADRGDGFKDPAGWEADSGFGHWYSIEQYFGSDSYGWEVKYDYEVISNHDDPEEAKEAGQAHFEKMVRGALTAGFAQRQQEPVAWRWRPLGGAVWIYNPEIAWLDDNRDKIEAEPLYTALADTSTDREGK